MMFKLSASQYTKLLAIICLSFFYTTVHAQIEQCFDAAPIPDGAGSATPGTPYVSTVTYDNSDLAFTDPIIDFNFNLAINHTWVGDLIVTLTSPIGTTVTLIDRPGTPPGTFGCGQNNIDTLLDDEAALPAEGQCTAPPAVSGNLTPTDPLSAFDGEQLFDEATNNGTWTLTVTDNAGFDTGSVLATSCIDGSTTTPVTINNFESSTVGDRLKVEWQTSSETFNIGFNVWGLSASQKWLQLNSRVIRSRSGNTLVPQNYRSRIRLNKFDEEITAVGVSAISSVGREDFFGPFEIGSEYGSSEVPDYIDWEDERNNYNAAMEAAGYINVNGRYRKSNKFLIRYLERRALAQKSKQDLFPTVNLVPSSKGLHSVSYDEIKAAGVDWKGAKTRDIAVSLNGKKVDRLITGANRRGQFDESSEIMFAVVAPEGENKRYITDNVYQLSVDRTLVSRVKTIKAPKLEQLTNTVAKRIEFGENKHYASNMSGPIPWFDTELFAQSSATVIGTASHKINFSVDSTIDTSVPAILKLSLFGGIDYPNVDIDEDGTLEPDHHIRLYLNRSEDSDPVWEGFSEGFETLAIETEVAATLLKKDSINELEIELIADSGNPFTIMSFDDGSIDYFQTASINNGDGLVSFPEAREGVEAYQISKAPGAVTPSVYAFDNHNHLVQIKTKELSETPDQIAFRALAADNIQYQLINPAQDMLNLDVEIAAQISDEAIDAKDAELLIIADAAFINEDLQSFADFHRTELNRSTKIISVQDIYQRFGFGMATPDAINRYLKYADQDSDYSSVLLVGGHTFNYLGFGQNGEQPLINSIPTFYVDINDVFEQQAPSENPFVDLDDDNVPDKAIGRWPVRNTAELKNIIDKTIQWHLNGSLAEAQTALLIAEGGSDNVFQDTIEELIPFLGGSDDLWADITKVYLNDIADNQSLPLAGTTVPAQQQIKGAIDNGRTLTIYSGHGSPNSWSFQDLVRPSTVASWENQGNPTMMLPLACYTSYYESESTNTLAHQMLLANDNAAVAISSAAVLAIEAHNQEFVQRLIVELTQNNLSLGESVLKVKRDLAFSSSDYEDIVTSWTTLADPTLSLHRIPIEQVEEEDENFNDPTITSKGQVADADTQADIVLPTPTSIDPTPSSQDRELKKEPIDFKEMRLNFIMNTLREQFIQ